jgi:hypothetical protein
MTSRSGNSAITLFSGLAEPPPEWRVMRRGIYVQAKGGQAGYPGKEEKKPQK